MLDAVYDRPLFHQVPGQSVQAFDDQKLDASGDDISQQRFATAAAAWAGWQSTGVTMDRGPTPPECRVPRVSACRDEPAPLTCDRGRR